MMDLLYRYPVDALYTGCSLGNYLSFVRFSKESDVRGLWSALDNQYYLGEWNVLIMVDGSPLPARETVFTPESQATVYGDEAVSAEKRFFIPYGSGRELMAPPSTLQSLILLLRLHNASDREVKFTIHHDLILPARTSPFFTKQPANEQTVKRVRVQPAPPRCDIFTEGRPSDARVFGTGIPWESFTADDERIGVEYRFRVKAHDDLEIPFVFAYANTGIADARAIFNRCRNGRELLHQASAGYREILGRTHIVTPDPLINRGLQWAKVNTVRVQHRFRSGDGFTNDPPQDIVVIRDLAWYALGSDYLTPEFSDGLFTLAAQHAFHTNGKLTEYIHADEFTPELHDYKLNINDDTPLYVYALYHHALIAGDKATFHRFYPLMRRACNYILSQIRQGLVRCYANGVNVWGICSWRNIIDGYNLTGAVTEINAECAFALECCARTARLLGMETDAAFYGEKAADLREAINTHLVSPVSSLYLLNLDNDGTPHHDVTGDLIFPLMFGVAEGGMRERLLARLTDDEMWTPYGSRTVSKQEANYDPDFGYQLVGGLWPNLTAWVAYCMRRDNPAKLVEGMRNIYKLCEPERPVDFVNVVPGEFPERIHGETFLSRGMAMSPWMPPTYLWLGVEGLLGLSCTAEEVNISPALPASPEWGWVAVKNLLLRGDSLTAFLYDGILYSSHPVSSSYPVRCGIVVESNASDNALFTIALLVDGALLLFAAAEDNATGTIRAKAGEEQFEREIVLRKGEANLIHFERVSPHS